MSKSPAFPFLSSFTAKSLGFNFFDSSVLGAETSPGQVTLNFQNAELCELEKCIHDIVSVRLELKR